MCFSISIGAQISIKKLIQKGDEALRMDNYSGALDYYGQAVEKDRSNVDLVYHYAEAARKQYAYALAEKEYQYLIDELDANAYPDAIFHLANIKNTLGQYEEAIRYYDLYLSEYGGDDALISMKANKAKLSAEWAVEQADFDETKLKITHLDDAVNTPYSEHAPLLDGDDLYFTSLRFEKQKDDHIPSRKISKILKTNEEVSQSVLLQNGRFNSNNLFTSSPTKSEDGKLMIYSVCDYFSGEIRCDLYYSKKTDDRWEEPVRLPGNINVAGKTQTHPNIGPEEDGKRVLYFSSNRPLGKGGMDIWQTSFDDDLNFTEPKRVAKINTADDDITPFYFEAKDELYFSSNGRKGFGAFDIYKAARLGKNYEKVSNLGKGINTSYIDMFYSVNKTGEIAHISSNRPGSMYLEDKFETCCFDIYRIDNNECVIDLLALTFDNETKDNLNGVTLVLEDLNNSESESVIITKEEINEFEFVVDCNGNYRTTATKEGYQPSTIQINVKEEMPKDGSDFEKKIYLKPEREELVLEVRTLEKATREALTGANVQLIDVETNAVVDIQSNTSGNDYLFNVIPGKKYRLIGRKNGYDDYQLDFDVPETAKGTITKELLLGRKAEIVSLENLLPLKLYYNNDHPEPRTMLVKTNKSYSTTYFNYYNKKEIFRNKYSIQFPFSQQKEASREVADFFENEVKDGFNKLTVFLETLNRTLASGKKVNIYLRGYASPLSRSDYNEALGKRRVDCIRNEFKKYQSGVLLKYMDSGTLIITERSFGENTSPTGISDDPSSPGKSIYSPNASRERRIEIDEIVEVIK